MSDNDEPMKAGYNLTRRRVEVVQAHADANYDGNASLALRKIIDEWVVFKGAQLPLPMVPDVPR